MEDTEVVITHLPGFEQNNKRVPGRIANRLVAFFFPLLTVILVAGSMYWLQWAAQYSIVHAYPTPTVQIVKFPGNPAQIGASLQFSASGSGRDLSYNWDFGDRSGASGASVAHSYSSSGQYNVTVTVTDGRNNSASVSETLTVHILAPVADFTFSVGTGGVVSFDASASSVDSSTNIASYNWDFGDGNTDTPQSPQDTHTYQSAGTYTVTLTITDGTGQSSAPVTQMVTVNF